MLCYGKTPCIPHQNLTSPKESQMTLSNQPNLPSSVNNDIILNDEYPDIPADPKPKDKDDNLFFTTVKDIETTPLKFKSINNKIIHSNSSATNFNSSASFQSIDFVSLIEHNKKHNKKLSNFNLFVKAKTISTADHDDRNVD